MHWRKKYSALDTLRIIYSKTHSLYFIHIEYDDNLIASGKRLLEGRGEWVREDVLKRLPSGGEMKVTFMEGNT